MSERLISFAHAREYGLFDGDPNEDGQLPVCFREGGDFGMLAELQRVAGRPLALEVLPVERFQQRLSEAFNQGGTRASRMVEDIADSVDLSSLLEEMPETQDLLEAEENAPVIRLINALLTEALREGASDIHFELFESRATVRFRIDGALRDVIEPQRGLHAAIVSRIKIMGGLDIAEKRLPQDGRITLRLAGRPVDVRVSTLPTAHGERVVLRLLDKSANRLDLDSLGMPPQTLTRLQGLLAQPHGILLVTGPTGSGKTTTLYAALAQMDARELNIMTVEDPIEYELDGIGQTQINSRIEMSFARALRAILRQDPDVILIGEIRDLETAQIAVQASLTGHLVLATLHTNDAPSAMTRLVDMGVEPFLLASSSIGVLAQRLVRRLCPACRVAYEPDAAEQKLLGIGPEHLIYRACGCEACAQTGYKGRGGIYELMVFDENTRSLIHDGANEQTLRSHSAAHGMQSLREDGFARVRAGYTAVDEILRVTRSESGD
ncbi:type II secretion system ATPase GspE [Uliginosibacterium aquaticum]|uniref:Type II secretion system protein E n=1 Tax=Uliginosibacterium aquaticum TaxID=2731212 RepID=A0ABX2IE76_9RHOO|nr:type II secretion system ATPase GspE [Uliginosibacterium aquaticum]NSL54088.1 type II secretion system ATPase GspE [Uliginosibacterium aquaticum]